MRQQGGSTHSGREGPSLPTGLVAGLSCQCRGLLTHQGLPPVREREWKGGGGGREGKGEEEEERGEEEREEEGEDREKKEV